MPSNFDFSSLDSRLLAVVAVLSIGSVATAVALQHLADMQPCVWCVLQRLVYLLIGASSVLALAMRRGPPRRVATVVATALSVAGLAAALWQQFVASRSQSCALTLADKVIRGLSLDEALPWLFKATAYCDEANVPLLGIPFAIWSAGLFVLLAVLTCVAALSRLSRSDSIR